MAWVLGIGIFAFLLFLFPRQVGGTVALVLIFGAAVGTFFYLKNETETKAKRKLEAKVEALASYNPSICSDPTHPIKISFFNGADKTVNAIRLTVEARRQGYSSVVFSRLVESDKILKFGDQYTACWSVDDYGDTNSRTVAKIPLNSLVLSVVVHSIAFE